MKRNLMCLLSGLMVATGVAAAQSAVQSQTTPVPVQSQKSTDVTLSGCVTQGSAPTVFILDNAKLSSADPKDAGKVYLLVASTTAVDLTTELNHEVTVTGTTDGRVAPPTGQKTPEKDLPKFTAKNIMMLADKCQPAK